MDKISEEYQKLDYVTRSILDHYTMLSKDANVPTDRAMILSVQSAYEEVQQSFLRQNQTPEQHTFRQTTNISGKEKVIDDLLKLVGEEPLEWNEEQKATLHPERIKQLNKAS